MALAKRLVEVVDPCEGSAEGSFYCEGRCVEVECSLLGQLQGPENGAPQLQLLFLEEQPSNNETVKQLPYGWDDGIPVVGSGNAGQPASSVPGRRRLLQDDDDDAALSSLDGSVLNIAYGFTARDPGLQGVAWSNPFIKPCSSNGVRECGALALDIQGMELSVSSLSPCTADVRFAKSWEDWKAAILEAAESKTFQSGGCPPEACSPSGSDEGLCLPGKYAYIYQSGDSNDRSNKVTTIIRIEHGSRHALSMTVALACAQGPSQLQTQVNNIGVDVAMPYMVPLGMQQQMVREVRVLGPIAVMPDVAHPVNNDDTPPLCLATMDLEIQAGCIPDEPGFKAGPSGNETEGQWCPCSIPWSPSHKDQPLELDQGTAYPVVADLFGPLVSIRLKTPAGSNPDGPSPFCAPLTPSSNSPEAQLRHNGVQFSIALDLQHWFLNGLDYIRRIRMLAEDLFFAMDNTIEEKWRLLMDDFQGYIATLKLGVQDLHEAATGPGASSVLPGLMGLNGVQLEQLEYLERMTATFALGLQEPESVEPSDISQAVLECVQRQRGGSSTQFTFVLPAGGVNERSEVEGSSAQTQSIPVNKWAGRKLLLDQPGLSLELQPHSNTGNAAVPSTPAAQQHTSGLQRVVGMRGQQQVLTGAAILQQRRPLASLLPKGARYSRLCREKGLAVDLSAECGDARMNAIRSSYGARKGEASAVSGGATGLPAIGVNPVFVNYSRIYDQQVALNPSNWYNSSEAAGQLNLQGIPYGFFPGSLPGFGALYPVIIDINLREDKLQQLMQYLKEGAFLDPFATNNVSVKIASFSVDIQLYGYTTIFAAYDDAGFIQAKFDIEVLAYTDYSFEGLRMNGMVSRLANDVILLLLVLLYCALTILDSVLSVQAQRHRAATLAKILTRSRRQSLRQMSFSVPMGSFSGRKGSLSFSMPQRSITNRGGSMSFSMPQRSFTNSRGSMSIGPESSFRRPDADVSDDDDLPSAFHLRGKTNSEHSRVPVSPMGPPASASLSRKPSASLIRPPSPPSLTPSSSPHLQTPSLRDSKAEGSTLPRRGRSLSVSMEHSLPQLSPSLLSTELRGHSLHHLGPSHLSRELRGQQSRRPLSLSKDSRVSFRASGPICEGLEQPAPDVPSHQTSSLDETGQHTSSDDEEDKSSSDWEESERSSDDGQEEESPEEDDDNDESDSKSVDKKVEECVDDYPILRRPSAASLARTPSMQPRDHRPDVLWQSHLEGDFYRMKMHVGWIVYEGCLCSLMLAAVALLFYYAFQLQPNKAPTERRAAVYDSVDSKARPLLLRRQFNGTESSRGMPGAPGRWAMGEESEAGLEAFGHMLEALEQMAEVKTAYALVQFFTLILLLVRFVYHTSFQPKLSVIAGTLARFVPDILYYLFIFLTFGSMLSSMLAIVFGGGSYSGVSSVSEGMLVVFKAIIAGSDASLMRFLHAAADGRSGFSNAAMLAMAWVVMVIVSLFFLFLMDVLVAIIMRPYARLRKGSMNAPGIHDDMAALFHWLRLTLKGCPSGPETARFLAFLQHERKAGDKLGLRSLSQIITRVSSGRLSRMASGHFISRMASGRLSRMVSGHFNPMDPARLDELTNNHASATDNPPHSPVARIPSILPRIMSGRWGSMVAPESYPQPSSVASMSSILPRIMSSRRSSMVAPEDHSLHSPRARLSSTLPRAMSNRRSSVVFPEAPPTNIGASADIDQQQRATFPASSEQAQSVPFGQPPESSGRSQTSPQVKCSSSGFDDAGHPTSSPSAQLSGTLKHSPSARNLQRRPSALRNSLCAQTSLREKVSFSSQGVLEQPASIPSAKLPGPLKHSPSARSLQRRPSALPLHNSLIAQLRRAPEAEHNSGSRAGQRWGSAVQAVLSARQESATTPSSMTPRFSNRMSEAETGDNEVVHGTLQRLQSVLGVRPEKVARAMQERGLSREEEEEEQEQAQRERAMLRTLLQGGISRSRKWTRSESSRQEDISVTQPPASSHTAASHSTSPPSAAPGHLSGGPACEGDMGSEDCAAGFSCALSGQDGALPCAGCVFSSCARSSGWAQQQEQQQQEQQEQQDPYQLSSSAASIVWRLVTEAEECVAMLGRLQATSQHLRALARSIQALLQRNKPSPAGAAAAAAAGSPPLQGAASLQPHTPDECPLPFMPCIPFPHSLPPSHAPSSSPLPFPSHPFLGIIHSVDPHPCNQPENGSEVPALSHQKGGRPQEERQVGSSKHGRWSKQAWQQEQQAWQQEQQQHNHASRHEDPSDQQQQQQNTSQHPASPRNSFFSDREHSGQLQPHLRSSISSSTKWASQRRARGLTKRVSFFSATPAEPPLPCRDNEPCPAACSDEVVPFAAELPQRASDRQEQNVRPVMTKPCAALLFPGRTAHTPPDAAASASSPVMAHIQIGMPLDDDSEWTPFKGEAYPPAGHQRLPKKSSSMPMPRLPPAIHDEDEGIETQQVVPSTAA
ncbi:hypothetical protein DUNSADRAFT_11704 [Dunaliella salina]|nr:hypothetical protein DUNSADRAFT_11704 [Dunaliella salina]|eukprot:KAF5832422.1 hypothetical protein DUNSADRAFT_11704 [Dunaliella salina]